MSKHFNGLSPAEDERLTYLAEELAEAIQAVCKIQRHGYDSYNPDAQGKGSNRTQLAKELGDVFGAINRLYWAKDMDPDQVEMYTRAAKNKSNQWMHHQ